MKFKYQRKHLSYSLLTIAILLWSVLYVRSVQVEQLCIWIWAPCSKTFPWWKCMSSTRETEGEELGVVDGQRSASVPTQMDLSCTISLSHSQAARAGSFHSNFPAFVCRFVLQSTMLQHWATLEASEAWG